MTNDPNQHHPLLNSARPIAPGAVATSALDAGAQVEVTLRLRRRAGASAPPAPGAESGTPAKSRAYSTREDFEAQYGASDEDIAAVAAFAKAHGLTVTETHPGRRSVMLEGAADKINTAFG